MKKILVPIDGSGNSKKALLKAKELGTLYNSEIVILNVVKDIVSHMYPASQQYSIETSEVLVELGKRLLEIALESFEGYPGVVETKLKRGNPGKEIIEEVNENDYDLVVIGSRGLGAFSRVFLGSVSNKVANHVNVNVLIVKC